LSRFQSQQILDKFFESGDFSYSVEENPFSDSEVDKNSFDNSLENPNKTFYSSFTTENSFSDFLNEKTISTASDISRTHALSAHADFSDSNFFYTKNNISSQKLTKNINLSPLVFPILPFELDFDENQNIFQKYSNFKTCFFNFIREHSGRSGPPQSVMTENTQTGEANQQAATASFYQAVRVGGSNNDDGDDNRPPSRRLPAWCESEEDITFTPEELDDCINELNSINSQTSEVTIEQFEKLEKLAKTRRYHESLRVQRIRPEKNNRSRQSLVVIKRNGNGYVFAKENSLQPGSLQKIHEFPSQQFYCDRVFERETARSENRQRGVSSTRSGQSSLRGRFENLAAIEAPAQAQPEVSVAETPMVHDVPMSSTGTFQGVETIAPPHGPTYAYGPPPGQALVPHQGGLKYQLAHPQAAMVAHHLGHQFGQGLGHGMAAVTPPSPPDAPAPPAAPSINFNVFDSNTSISLTDLCNTDSGCRFRLDDLSRFQSQQILDKFFESGDFSSSVEENPFSDSEAGALAVASKENTNQATTSGAAPVSGNLFLDPFILGAFVLVGALGFSIPIRRSHQAHERRRREEVVREVGKCRGREDFNRVLKQRRNWWTVQAPDPPMIPSSCHNRPTINENEADSIHFNNGVVAGYNLQLEQYEQNNPTIPIPQAARSCRRGYQNAPNATDQSRGHNWGPLGKITVALPPLPTLIVSLVIGVARFAQIKLEEQRREREEKKRREEEQSREEQNRKRREDRAN
jgi:hypothetical protein